MAILVVLVGMSVLLGLVGNLTAPEEPEPVVPVGNAISTPTPAIFY